MSVKVSFSFFFRVLFRVSSGCHLGIFSVSFKVFLGFSFMVSLGLLYGFFTVHLWLL